MPTLQLTDEQVLKLVEQTPSDLQAEVVRRVLTQRRKIWDELSHYGLEYAREAAALRGFDWDAMTEEERE